MITSTSDLLRPQIERHRGARPDEGRPELPRTRDGIREAERDPEGPCDGERLRGTAGRDRPGVRIVDHLADRRVEDRADAAEGDVADELLPYQLIDVVVGPDVEAGLAPDLGHVFDPRGDRAAALAEPDELETVMVDVPRLDHRRAESRYDA